MKSPFYPGDIKRGMGKHSGEATILFSILPSFIIKALLLKKRIATLCIIFLRVDPILEGLHCPGKQTRSHKSLL